MLRLSPAFIFHIFIALLVMCEGGESQIHLTQIGGVGGFAIDIIIYSGMLNNLSFQYLLIRAEKPKKIQKTLISLYEPDKRRRHKNKTSMPYMIFFLTICLHLLAFCNPSCQSSKLLCICDHREYRSIVYRSVLNYSCH